MGIPAGVPSHIGDSSGAMWRWSEWGGVDFEHTHPASLRTLTAIKFASLATPNLVPPAVPLLLVYWHIRAHVEGTLTIRECRGHCHLRPVSNE